MNIALREQVDRFFHPRSVALIGVSRSFGFGHGLPRFLVEQGWGDRLYPVNPNLREIEGLRVYSSIREVPVDIDLACILVPAHAVETVLRECIEKGVGAIIVMSAGFAETGPEGQRRQESLARMAREAGVRMMGPNCIGVVDVRNRFATAEVLVQEIEPGSISIVAQSGVFGNILLDEVPSLGLGIAKVATIGNRADLDETDLLSYYGQDPDTRVIVLYLESIKRGGPFLDTARRVGRSKPVLAYLGGQTDAGRRATMSHTGSMSGFGRLDRDVLRQAGIWIARDPLELLETAKVFAWCPLPRGNRVLVVTASGSLGVMAADRIGEEGLSFAVLPASLLEGLREKAPPWMNLGNPLDVGPSGLFREGLDLAFRSREVDAVIAFPVIPWAVVSHLLRESPQVAVDMFFNAEWAGDGGLRKPVVLSVPGHPEWSRYCKRLFGRGAPIVSTPQAAVRSVGALYRYGAWRRRQGDSTARTM